MVSGKTSRLIALLLKRIGVTTMLLVIVFGCILLSECGMRWGRVDRILLSVPLAVSVLVTLGWFLYCVHRVSRTWQWRVFGFAIIFCWAFIAFLTDPVRDESTFGDRLLDSADKTATMLFSKRSGSEVGYSAAREFNYTALQIALALYLGTFLFSFFGRVVVNCVRIFFIPERRRNVFWGVDKREMLLARSLFENESTAIIQFNLPKSLVHESTTGARLTDLADELDACWCFVDFECAKGRCLIGRRNFFLSYAGRRNLEMAEKIARIVMDSIAKHGEVEFFVRAGDVDDIEIFSTWSQSIYERSQHKIRAFVLHEPEMVARKFATQFSLLESPSARDALHIESATVTRPFCRTLLMGFDHTGRALVNAQLGGMRFVDDKMETVVCPMTIIDMKDVRWERFLLGAPEIGKDPSHYGLQFKCFLVGSRSFEDWLRPNLANFDRFVLCLANETDNMREALRIQVLLQETGLGMEERNVEILVRTSSHAMNQIVKETTKSSRFPMCGFGSLSDLYTIEFLENDPVDRLAQALNWRWSVGKTNSPANQYSHEKAEELWKAASYYNRQSSRASALSVLSCLRLLGLRWYYSSDGRGDLPLDEIRKRVGDAKEALARTEHLRWCAYMAAHGVRSWNLHEPISVETVLRRLGGAVVCKSKPNSLANQVDVFRAHAAMVPFDELPQVDMNLAHVCGLEGSSREEFAGFGSGGVQTASLQGNDYGIWLHLAEVFEDLGSGVRSAVG